MIKCASKTEFGMLIEFIEMSWPEARWVDGEKPSEYTPMIWNPNGSIFIKIKMVNEIHIYISSRTNDSADPVTKCFDFIEIVT